MSKEQVIQALQESIKGLTYQSESDEPFEVVYWPGTKDALTPQKVVALSGHKLGSPVEVIAVEDFFKPLLKVESWYGTEEKAQVKQYQKLQRFVQQHLTAAKVYRIGRVNVAIYLLGLTADGDIAGVKTQAVET